MIKSKMENQLMKIFLFWVKCSSPEQQSAPFKRASSLEKKKGLNKKVEIWDVQ